MSAIEIVLVIFTWLGTCFLAGFIDAWWEQHQRDKANRGK